MDNITTCISNGTDNSTNCSQTGPYLFSGPVWRNPFTISHIRIIFILIYSLVFCLCIIGNLLVIFVVLRSRRMRSVTNYLLANLALADLFVGIFCVLPTLFLYMNTVWVSGRIMCKLNFFVQQFSYSASVSLLVVISLERYIAITWCMKTRILNTWRRLVLVTVGVWVVSFSYNAMQLFLFDEVVLKIGGPESIILRYCRPIGFKIDRRVYTTVNFFLWYAMPLSLVTFVYIKIGIVLWRSTKIGSEMNITSGRRTTSFRETTMTHSALGGRRSSAILTNAGHPMVLINLDENNGDAHPPSSPNYTSNHETGFSKFADGKEDSVALTRQSVKRQNKYHDTAHGGGHHHVAEDKPSVSFSSNSTEVPPICATTISCLDRWRRGKASEALYRQKIQTITESSSGAENVLRSRRKVIRLLIVVVGSFALCSLPYHFRSLMQAWGETVPDLFNPISMFLMFFNSGLNPILYAFLSMKFRRAMKDMCPCSCSFRYVCSRHSYTHSQRDEYAM
ncbi:trissin receptor-like [Lineus longissimus]|uniref:trissin receptor-like n=1 Tax=Lineus longissimus TaxID=88925 RepID=UPI00315DAB60